MLLLSTKRYGQSALELYNTGTWAWEWAAWGHMVKHTSPYFSPPGYFPAPVIIETAGSAPSKPRSKPKPKRKRVRAGSESEGEPSGGDSSSGDEDGDKGKDLLHKLFGDGGEL